MLRQPHFSELPADPDNATKDQARLVHQVDLRRPASAAAVLDPARLSRPKARRNAVKTRGKAATKVDDKRPRTPLKLTWTELPQNCERERETNQPQYVRHPPAGDEKRGARKII